MVPSLPTAPGASYSSPVLSAPPPASAAPTTALPTQKGEQRLSGTVEAGVEPNCLVLRDSSGSHVLVFDDPGLKTQASAGSKVTLVGRSDPKMMTTCMQGAVFVVTGVSRN